MRRALALSCALLICQPAHAQDWQSWEAAYQTASAIDFVVTNEALRSGRAVEANPLLGRSPSTAKLLAFKIATGAGHYLATREIARRDPHTAKLLAMVSTFVMGGVVVANMRFVF